jgi:ADP-heptose:LPS heptosyltransferase
MSSKKSSAQRILFVSFSNLGDAVLSLPALDALIHYCPDAEVDVVCGPGARCVFEGRTDIRTVYADAKRPFGARIRLWLQLKKNRYDRVIDLRKSVFGLLGRQKGPFWIEKAVHMRDRHLNVIKALGFNVEPFRIGSGRAVPPDGLTGQMIVIAPGSKSSTKEWPLENFAALADRLIADDAIEIVWIGDQRERPRVDAIRAQMKHPSVNLAGQLEWADTLTLIKNSALVITNDSAPLHASDHLGKKTLAIFGPTDPARYGPQGTQEGILFSGRFCSPCDQAQCRYGHRNCLSDITVDEAHRRACRLLEDAPERGVPNVLVVRLDRIGDVMLSFPAVRAIREKYPLARITWLVRPHARDLVERCPDSDAVLVYDYGRSGEHRSLFGYFSLVRQMMRRRFDQVFVLHPTLRSHLLTALSGIPYRAGYAVEGGALLTHKILDLRSDGYQHESRYAMDVVRSLGVPPVNEEAKLLIFDADRRAARALLTARGIMPEEPYAVFHAASSSISKCWPREYFAQLGREIAQKHGLKIVLAGDEASAGTNAWLTEQILGAVDLSGKTPLMVLAALCGSASVVVSNDSGPSHVAAASGAAVISIFGRKEKGLSERRWRPMGPRSIALRKEIGCVVCLADRCTIGFECLRALTSADVMRAVDGILANVCQNLAHQRQ